LQVITSTARRGAERFAVALAPELAWRGLTVRTVALVDAPAPALEVEVLGSSRLGPATLRALRRAAGSASVVVAHGSTTLPASFLATLGTGVPFVYRNIGDPRYWATTRARRLRTRFLLSRAETVVALTAETGRRLTEHYGIGPERITAIPRGVAQAEFPRRSAGDRERARAALGIDPSARVAVCVGALSPEKDIPNAVDAMALLPERWQLLVAGEGPDRPAVEAAAAAVPGDRIRLLGQVADPASLLAAADLLVLPSRTEGLPGVVIEAGMVGVASVVTDVGFVGEIVEDGVSGHVVPAGDPAALADGILRSEPELDRLGQAAHDRVSAGFSLAAAADRWFEILSPLAAARRAGSEPPA
jgi:glycosyltransferase involved in cell wall biosynthesis